MSHEYYEDTHNVKTATTEEGAVYTFEYDSFGNTTKVSVGTGAKALSSSATYSTDGNFLTSTTDPLAKVTTYGYNEDTGVLEWVQYPKDTAATRTSYEYDSLYRMTRAACTTSTHQAMSVEYSYTDDSLTSIETPTTTYDFTYGAFGLRESVSIGEQDLATYTYTNDQNRYLQALNYGNLDYINYTYDQKGRLQTQTYEDGDTVSYAYDNNGALATVTDSATGRTTTYYYDLTDRMMKYTEKGTNFSHSVGYEYNAKNNLTQQVETINGTAHTTSYTYDKDNRVETVTADGTTVEYTYDTYGRIEKKVTKAGETAILTEEYTFTETELGTSTQIATHTVTAGTSETVYTYTYDNNGNILSVTTQVNTISRDSDGNIQRVNDQAYATTYSYDSANQLTDERNYATGTGGAWCYDAAGNITSFYEYCYEDGSDGFIPNYEYLYEYENEGWGDLLASYDGESIVRDDIGNPLSYDGWTYTWEHGRQLALMSKNGTNWTYTYNADGLRTAKTNGTDTWNYVYNGSQLTQMTKGVTKLHFTYDANGTPLTVSLNGYVYYYVTNLQGDVIGIANANGTLIVSYSYNAWGVCTITSNATTFALLNPLRYRGYVYDQETGLYYLQSRYYDPQIGRFINADGFAATGQGFVGNNMFAYCGNNPIANIDSTGLLFEKNAGGGGGGLAYAGPAGGHIARPTTPTNPTLIIPFVPPSTTYGIDELRAETMSIRKDQALVEAQAIAITVPTTASDDAIYFGADMKGGPWKIVTPPMSYQEAKVWTVVTATSQTYGKGASWGLYTLESADAHTMAWDLGFGGMPIPHIGRKGEYPHYHVCGSNLFGVYKHFHVWYGSIYEE